MNDVNPTDPLAQLIMDDPKALDRDLLVSILKSYVGFDKEGQIIIIERFRQLQSNTDKIEMLFIASKARALLFVGKPEGLTQIELIKLDVMPVGSVKTTLKRLSDQNKVVKNRAGAYYIPTYRLSELSTKFNKEEKTNL